jgi:cytosol aminopeptidase
MEVALGQVFSGVFSVSEFGNIVQQIIKVHLVLQTSDELWSALHTAGEAEYDRFWRMPLDEDFGPQIYKSNADLCKWVPWI